MISVISIFDLEHISELVYEISTCDFHGHQLCEITEKGQTQRFMFFAINFKGRTYLFATVRQKGTSLLITRLLECLVFLLYLNIRCIPVCILMWPY